MHRQEPMVRMFFFCITLMIKTALSGTIEVNDQFFDFNSRVTHKILKNGINVYLAPSNKVNSFKISIKVNAGQNKDELNKDGTAHLLEHILFTDQKFSEDTTYLEIIKKEGGEANAETSEESTEYYATVPKNKAKWIVSIFHKLITRREFDENTVEKSKGPVQIEIGKAGLSDYLILWLNKIYPETLLKIPSFEEEELGDDSDKSQTHFSNIFNKSIQLKDLKKYYNQYYSPQNMTMYISGNFNIDLILRELEKWSSLPKTSSYVLEKNKIRKVKVADYIKESISQDDPQISLGYKVKTLTLKQYIMLDILFEYYQYLLFKQIRNKDSSTYSVYKKLDYREGGGYFRIALKTHNETYFQVLKKAKNLVFSNVANEIDRNSFLEAKDLYIKSFLNTDESIQNLEKYLKKFQFTREKFPHDSPQNRALVAQEIEYDLFHKEVPILLNKNMKMEVNSRPVFFFRYEAFFIYLFAFIVGVYLSKKIFLKDFKHNKVQWIRNLIFPPAYLLEIIYCIPVLVVVAAILRVLSMVFNRFSISVSHAFLNEYTMLSIGIVLIVFVFQFSFSMLIKKSIIVDQALILKSIGFYAKKYSLENVYKIEVRSIFSVVLNFQNLKAVKWRFYFYNPLILSKGLLIRFSDGSAVFLSITNAKAAKNEIEDIVLNFNLKKSQNIMNIAA